MANSKVQLVQSANLDNAESDSCRTSCWGSKGATSDAKLLWRASEGRQHQNIKYCMITGMEAWPWFDL
ncbi:hypothetical protein HDU77_010735, partial [Chytriomyces hyalinus]